MSYTNTINSTRTPEHHIVSDENSKLLNAQGNSLTGQVLKKVANFIGMEDVQQKPSAPGYLSTDLELDLSARRSAFGKTASLESDELTRRTDDYYASLTGKVLAHRISDDISQWTASGNKLRESRERVESRRFVRHVHQFINEIERFERDRRLDDHLGEKLRQGLALELSSAVQRDLASPHLKPLGPVAVAGPIKQKLDRATEVASEAAGSILGSVYQIGNFAVRAAYFFGGKAAAKAHVLEQEAAAKAPVLLEEASKTAAHLGEQAAATAHVLGEQASIKGADLKFKATAIAHQWIDGANKAAHEATVAVETNVQEALAAGKESLEALFEPSTLTWSDLASLENAERSYRMNEGLCASRFMLALHTSALINAFLDSSADGHQARFYGTAVLEEMERARRIAQDLSCPTARLNSKRAAGAVMVHRRKALCKQSAQIKAQERFEHVKATSPQAARSHVHFAADTQPHTKRAVPQVASKRYNYIRESSHENLLPSQQGRAAM